MIYATVPFVAATLEILLPDAHQRTLGVQKDGALLVEKVSFQKVGVRPLRFPKPRRSASKY